MYRVMKTTPHRAANVRFVLAAGIVIIILIIVIMMMMKGIGVVEVIKIAITIIRMII